MAMRKGTEGWTIIYKAIHRKQKIEQHEPHKNQRYLMCPGRVGSSCSTNDNRGITFVTKVMTIHEWEKNQVVITTNETYP
jgi:hypothetical protein